MSVCWRRVITGHHHRRRRLALPEGRGVDACDAHVLSVFTVCEAILGLDQHLGLELTVPEADDGDEMATPGAQRPVTSQWASRLVRGGRGNAHLQLILGEVEGFCDLGDGHASGLLGDVDVGGHLGLEGQGLRGGMGNLG